jgi:hypothetical protein
MNASESNKKLKTVTDKLATTAKGLQDQLHQHMLNIGDHIAAHGDVTPATYLVSKLDGSSQRVNAIRQWFLTFGGCGWNAGKKTFTKSRDTSFRWDRKEAEANPFWSFTPEPAFKPLDGLAILKGAVLRIMKANKVGFVLDDDGKVVNGPDGKPMKHKNVEDKLAREVFALLKSIDDKAAQEVTAKLNEVKAPASAAPKEGKADKAPAPAKATAQDAPAAIH